MKEIHIMKKITLALLFMLAAVPMLGQQTGGTQTSQQATHFDAATQCVSLDAASGSATLATPQSGYSWYVTILEANVGATGTVTAAAPVKLSTAGITGTPTFGLFRSDGMTIGQVGSPLMLQFGNGGLKGLTNTAVSITGGAVTNLVWHGTLCGYQAP
jgi:hypothetical protein